MPLHLPVPTEVVLVTMLSVPLSLKGKPFLRSLLRCTHSSQPLSAFIQDPPELAGIKNDHGIDNQAIYFNMANASTTCCAPDPTMLSDSLLGSPCMTGTIVWILTTFL